MPSRSIRTRRGRSKLESDFELQLTSLLDILIIVLVFLLKTFAISTNSFSSLPGMEPPMSASPDNPPDSLHLIITPEAMTFEDERIVEFEQSMTTLGGTQNADYRFERKDLKEGGRMITPLYDALVKAREKAETLRAKSQARDQDGNPLPFDGILAIQADKRINYDVLRKVMYTAATAEFRVFRMLALKKDQ